MNTINYKDLKNWYLDNTDARENAKKYFGDKQPSIYNTGFYSAPSWNWGYNLGIAGVNSEGEIKYFEVVTQFGGVKAARRIHVPIIEEAK